MRLHQAVDIVSKGTQAELHALRSCQGSQTPLRAPPLSPFDLAPVSETLHEATKVPATIYNALCRQQASRHSKHEEHIGTNIKHTGINTQHTGRNLNKHADACRCQAGLLHIACTQQRQHCQSRCSCMPYEANPKHHQRLHVKTHRERLVNVKVPFTIIIIMPAVSLYT